MRVLALIIALASSLNAMAEGFSVRFDIAPSTTVKQDSENSNATDLDFFFSYINSGHNITLRPGFRYSDSTGETVNRDVRLRHRFMITKIDDFSFNSDFRLLFQGEASETKSVGELNRMRFGPSVSYSVDVGSTNWYTFYKPILSHNFKDERFSLNEEGTEQTPVILNDIVHYAGGGFSHGRFSLEVAYGYQMKWNSLGVQVDDGFELYEELAYNANENLTIIIGHVSAGDLYNNDGQNNNISFINPDGDTYYARLMLKF